MERIVPYATRISDDARRVIVSLNPKAGARSGRPQVEELCERLSHRGWDCKLETDIDRVAALSEKYSNDGELRAVVSAGGDGTARLVVNRTPQGTPVLVFPLGTENLLAKHLKIRRKPRSALQAIEDGVTVSMDAGRANGHIFLLMLGCGFDAKVVNQVHTTRTGHITRWSYFKPILSAMRRYDYPELRVTTSEVTVDGNLEEETRSVRWAFVVNLPRYAGGLRVVPDADGHDGMLDVCTFRRGSLINALWYVAGVFLRAQRTMRGCVMTKSSRIHIDSDEEVHYQIDGDPGGVLPVEVEVLPQRLQLVVHKKWARKHGFELASDGP